MSKFPLSPRAEAALAHLPLVAILRGLRPEEAVQVCQAVYDQGFRLIEIPLNSPDPFSSIAAVRKALPQDALVGAGTVLDVDSVRRLRDMGADLVVSPNANPEVIRESKACGLLSMPAIMTPTEAFSAIEAGADMIKLFPAELIGTAGLKALLAVVPTGTGLYPVGGVSPENMADYVQAGAAGFGLGSALYRAGMSAQECASRAAAFVSAWRKLSQ